MRSTLILGFIGVPTIGFDLETYFNQGDYRQVAALILAFYALIATRGLWARSEDPAAPGRRQPFRLGDDW